MKRIRFALCIFLCMVFVFLSQATSQESFLQGNVAYRHAEFKKAINFYQAITNKGPAAWYNLGNCYYHEQDYSNALLCWKRALQYDDSSLEASILYNCDQAYQKLGYQSAPTLVERLNQKICSYSLARWQVIFLVVWLLFLSCFFSIITRKYRALGIFFCMLLSVSSACLGIKCWKCTQEYALVKNQCRMVAGTDERFAQIALMAPGCEVAIKEKKGEWCKVASKDHCGWIVMKNIDFI